MQEALNNKSVQPSSINPIVKSLRGAPRKYTREALIDKLIQYFSDESNIPYSILELCVVLGVTRETLSEWATNKKYGLSDVVMRAKYLVAAGWEKGTKIHPRLAEFLLMNHMGYSNRESSVQYDVTVVHPGELLPMADVMRRLREVAPAVVDADFEVVGGAIAQSIANSDDIESANPHDS